MLLPHFSTTIFLLCLFFFTLLQATNLTLPHQHPSPDSVALHVLSSINASLSRRQLSSSSSSTCRTGNPIDDCWRCTSSDWSSNRQRLADCSIGFGRGTLGGKNGKIYVVTDSSDNNPSNPTPGTLRYAVIQEEPLWIVFSSNMLIRLRHELIINSYKTIDGRGSAVHITGNGCLTVQYVQHVIIHNVHIYDCKPSGGAVVAATPTKSGRRGRSDGDGISIFGAQKIWIDHCSMSHCTDGLIDAVMGSTAITISNNYFAHHDEVMLLGHDDSYGPDTGMQVTIAFNHFGQGLVQRMPRCRRGYIHVVNNDFTSWKMYAIGGSGNPTINSQGNRYIAPSDPSAKEVTKRVDSKDDGEWSNWNWRTEGDLMENGAFFVASGGGVSALYSKASSVEPKASALVDQLTRNAGVFGGPSRDDQGQSGDSYSGYGGGGGGGGSGGGGGGSSGSGSDGGTSAIGGTTRGSSTSSSDDSNFFGMIFGSNAPPRPRLTLLFCLIMISVMSLSTLLSL
ncbi:hypothetical protein HID58_035432 [Brassica napus]|uniref:Pectate lyase n=1 Tax=Brassica napus TaxID=3708 RepID=A0A816PE36_BRANA|nr:hypothetical protein HID58_035432 [Brassica napus]CAF2047597.1 unnamed protein product [Brassica napus]